MRNAVLFAGVSSGSGKTAVVTGVLAALKSKGVEVSAFKCGPDYIDPMFHRQVMGLPSFNLDPFFLEPAFLRETFMRHARAFSVVEGVMGYYDGVGTEGRYSTYAVAQALGIPVVLVVNASSMATSVGALVQGFKHFKPDSGIQGVIFNRISPMMYPFLQKVAADVGVRAFGYLPKDEGISIESRHLGLRTDVDSDEMKNRLKRLEELAEKYIDLDGILELGKSGDYGSMPRTVSVSSERKGEPHVMCAAETKFDAKIAPIVAVARDEAFCFLYEENIEILKNLGAKVVFFSPLHDAVLPKADALYIPGGYPELHLEALSGNRSMLASVREAVGRGTPTLAECGGFMYLHEEIDGVPVVGSLKGRAFRTPKLQRFGYVHLKAGTDNLLCRAGEEIRSHEFHYYDSTDVGEDFEVTRARGGQPYRAVVAGNTLFAGFPHLYFGANTDFARNFVEAARRFSLQSHEGCADEEASPGASPGGEFHDESCQKES